MLAIHNAVIAAANPGFDPINTLAIVRNVIIALVSLLLIWVTVTALAGPGRKGNSAGVWQRVFASLTALIPGAIGVAGVGLVIAATVLGWGVPGLDLTPPR